MNDYLRWSLRQLYLLFFWPTKFERENEGLSFPSLRFGERFRYLIKMLPSMFILCVVWNLVAGSICEAMGIGYQWSSSWPGVANGVAFGVIFGVASGVAGGVAFCMAFGVATGLAFGMGFGGMFGVASGVIFGVASGVVFGVVSGVVVGVMTSVAVGVAGGVMFGVASGVVFGVAHWLTYFRLITYPFDAALSAATYFAARWQPQMVARAWRWCPVAWNEMIWLPLPFVSKLLVLLVQRDREEGFRQISFVAAERSLQRRHALRALVEVVISDLQSKSVPKLADLARKLAWTANAPVELPTEVSDALPQLDRITRHAEQYLTLNSAYLKSQALKQALAEVEALQRTLIASRGRYGPRLLQVVNDWRGLLDRERESTQAMADAARDIPNPYVFGKPIGDTAHNVFSGRRDIVNQIEASVLGAAQTPTLLLHGPRRMGKTSILAQLPRLLGPDFAPATLDCQNPAATESLAALLRYISRTVSDGLRQRRVTVPPLTASALEREPYAVFDNWLDSVEGAMPGKMRALLCLDEYEYLQTTLDAGW